MALAEFYDPVAKKKIEYNVSNKLFNKWGGLSKVIIKQNDDRVYVVIGQEGCGKSTWTFQQAKFIDPTFNIDRICFTAEQFLEQIKTAPKGCVVVFDEAFRGFSSKSSQSKVNKLLVQSMMEVRRRNLIIFIVTPSLILLEHYIVVHRSNALFHIYKRKVSNKITFNWKAYNRNKTAEIYEKAKKRYGVFPKIFTSMRDRFFARLFDINGVKRHLPYETFDEVAYDNKKGIAFGDKKSEEDLDISVRELRELKYKISQLKPTVTRKLDIAATLGVTDRTLRMWKTYGMPEENGKDGGSK